MSGGWGGQVSDSCALRMGTAQRREQSGRYIVCKRESERCGRCISKFSALYECATTRRPQGKCQELYWLPTASSGLDPTYPTAWLGILVAPHLPSRIESVAGVVGVGWTEQTLRFSAVPCGPLRLSPCIQYHESHATCWLRCAAPFGETRL